MIIRVWNVPERNREYEKQREEESLRRAQEGEGGLLLRGQESDWRLN